MLLFAKVTGQVEDDILVASDASNTCESEDESDEEPKLFLLIILLNHCNIQFCFSNWLLQITFAKASCESLT